MTMEELKPQYVRISGTGRFTRLLAGIPSTAGMKSGYVTLNPGEAVGEHRTDAREEAVIILEGRAGVFCGQARSFIAEAPGLVYIPPDTLHDIRNEGNSPLRYVYVVAPV
jgi:mannose-6-phosphate isomerase-like protein (cupin superfamily)